MKEFVCEISGERVDVFLQKSMPELSRSRIQKIIETENILVNKKATKANYKLRAGDIITVEIPESIPVSLKAENIPLTILFEDEHIIVIDKAPGLVVHPGAGNWEGTLVNALLHHCGSTLGKGMPTISGELRPGIVHRIDKNTSGILVVTKTDASHHHLSDQFKKHSITRKYLGICWGDLPSSGEWNESLGRDPKDRQKVTFREDGKKAITLFKRLEKYGGLHAIATFFEAELKTGRTHQIRAHFSHHGFPLLGDLTYTTQLRSARQKKEVGLNFITKKNEELFSAIKNLQTINRQFLHAAHLSFIHPHTSEKISFDSPLPSDLKHIYDLFRTIK